MELSMSQTAESLASNWSRHTELLMFYTLLHSEILEVKIKAMKYDEIASRSWHDDMLIYHLSGWHRSSSGCRSWAETGKWARKMVPVKSMVWTSSTNIKKKKNSNRWVSDIKRFWIFCKLWIGSWRWVDFHGPPRSRSTDWNSLP